MVAELAAATFAIFIAVRAALLIAAPAPEPPLQELDVVAGAAEDAIYAAAARLGGNPFRQADDLHAALSSPLTESALNIVLYGTWRGSAGASAMMSAEGAPQRKVAVGGEIVAGVRLEEVQDEFVVISNNGAREAVAIVNRRVDMTTTAPLSESAIGEAPAPTSAPLRDPWPGLALLTDSANGEAQFAKRPADTIAAAAPHETD